MTQATSFLGSLGRALAAMALYAGDHPSVQHAVEKARHDLEQLLAATPHPVLTFIGDTALFGEVPLTDLRGWEWSERLSAAGIQRIQFDRPLTGDQLAAFLSDLLRRLAAPGQLPEPGAASAVAGVRYGAIGLRGDAAAAQAPMATATLDLSLNEEFEAARWLEEEVRGHRTIPLVEAETIVGSLSVALHAGEDVLLPLVELKQYDQYSTTHSLNVALLSMGLAERAGYSGKEVHDIGVAGLLHDIGKTLVPVEILNKSSAHTRAEREIMMRHPADGARLILRTDDELELAAVVAYEHHIRQDGGGYPARHFARTAHPASRLVRVCDVFDALRTCRPYRDAWPLDKAVAFLREQAGVGFDPEFVEPFVEMTTNGAGGTASS